MSSTNSNNTNMNINALFNKEFTYEKIKEIADWLLERVSQRPKIAIVCGSGLGQLVDRLTEKTIFPYESVPDFPISTGKAYYLHREWHFYLFFDEIIFSFLKYLVIKEI
jgi:hypothetical protein